MADSNIGRMFRHIGRTNIFAVVEEKTILDNVSVVVGHSTDGKYRTSARVQDVIFL